MLNLNVKSEITNVKMLLKNAKMPLNASKKTHYWSIKAPSGQELGLELYIYKRLLNTMKRTGIKDIYWVIDEDCKQLRLFGGDLEATKGTYCLNLM